MDAYRKLIAAKMPLLSAQIAALGIDRYIIVIYLTEQKVITYTLEELKLTDMGRDTILVEKVRTYMRGKQIPVAVYHTGKGCYMQLQSLL